MKNLRYSFLRVFIFYLIFAFSACSSGTMGTSNDEINEKIKNGDYVKLNLHSKNTIIRGKDIFNTVMKKYQPVIDFYGEDSEVFQNLVNTNLLLDAEKLTSPDEKMFNYDSLKAWGDTEFIVEYEDGTAETVLADEALTASGSCGPDAKLFKNGKSVLNIVVEGEKISEYRKKIIDLLNSKVEYMETPYNTYEDLDYAYCRIDGIITDTGLLEREEGKAIFSIYSNAEKAFGCVSLAFDITQMVSIVYSDQRGDEIPDNDINIKLDHIVELIKGIYTHMEFIDNRLAEIQGTIVSESNKQIHLDLVNIINTVKGKMDELNIASSLDAKIAVAADIRTTINGLIQNYSDYSMIDYSNFVAYHVNYAKSDLNYLPLQIKINIPHRRYYANKNPSRIECTLTDFTMNNPTTFLPFTYEGLGYLKKLYVTRFNINSFNETDEDNLNATNSTTALIYLKNDGVYIGKLRSKINEAYIDLNQELTKTILKINSESIILGSLTQNYVIDLMIQAGVDDSHFTVKDNWNLIIKFLSTKYGYSNADSPYYEYNAFDGYGLWGLPDLLNSTPRFSAAPACIWGNGDPVIINDFPYAPSIVFDTKDPLELLKSADDDSMLDDATKAIDVYYKAKSNKLLEFAASLAALEIQLAMYLDDEDYEEYAK